MGTVISFVHAALVTSSLAVSLLALQPPAEMPLTAPEAERETVHVGDLGDRIVTYLKHVEAYGFSGAVLAAKNGQIVAAVAAGSADLEGVVLNTPSTLFEIASVTKQFTAAAVMRLVQDGKLSLDDLISKHLPAVPDNCSAITVRHLLQHTSGVPGTNSRGAGTNAKKVVPMFLRGGPKNPPGTHWEYWNQGYSLLSEIIASASGKSYTTYCRETLFELAGMRATRFTGDSPPMIEGVRVAVGRSASGKPRGALEHPYGDNYGFEYRGMGGVVTNVWDLWRWDRALHEQNAPCVLNAESQAELFKPGLNDYAMGWFVQKDAQGRTVQSHGGSVRGFTCKFIRLPDDDGCVIVLANRDDAPVEQVAQAVQAILLGPPYVFAEPPALPPPAIVADIVGKYKDAEGNVLAIKADGKVIRATVRWAKYPSLLTQAFIGQVERDGLVLFEWSGITKITISRDDQEAVNSLSISDQKFKRVPD